MILQFTRKEVIDLMVACVVTATDSVEKKKWLSLHEKIMQQLDVYDLEEQINTITENERRSSQ